MASTTEIRAWLRENRPELGVDARGRLSEEHRAIYDNARADDDYPTPGDGPDLSLIVDGGVSAADFDSDETEPPPPPLKAETRPRTARQSRREDKASARKRHGGLLGRLIDPPADTPKGKTGSKAKPQPRISLDKLVTRLYTRAGQMTSAIAPATGRCLQAQAAMAGVILEDVAHGTIVDRFLQPIARTEDRLDKVFALAAPPLIVFALETSNPDDQVRRVMLTGFLREALTISLEISDTYADQIKANLQANERREAEVNDLMALIFGVVQGETVPEPEMAGAAA